MSCLTAQAQNCNHICSRLNESLRPARNPAKYDYGRTTYEMKRGSAWQFERQGCWQNGRRYTLKELPQPQVLRTFGLLNLNPEPSSVSM